METLPVAPWIKTFPTKVCLRGIEVLYILSLISHVISGPLDPTTLRFDSFI